MAKIAVFVGSLQEKSHNKMLAKAMEELAPEGVEFQYVDINLPLFNEDVEVEEYPAKAQEMKDIITAADGVLFVTPEYNRGIPGVLKNAIDWASRPYGTSAFAGKPAGIVGATLTPTGTVAAQADLRSIAIFLEMKVMGQPEIYVANAGGLFSEEGVLTDERWRKNLTAYMAAFAAWVEKQK